MNPRSLGFGLALVLLITSESSAATCDSLVALSLPNTTITLAQAVAAGVFSATITGPAAAAGGCHVQTAASVLPRGGNVETFQ